MNEVTIRIWHGCSVRQVMTVSDTGSTTVGAVGGAQNSSHPDIEFDPWANLIVDHRAEFSIPVSTHHQEPEPIEDPWDDNDGLSWTSNNLPPDIIRFLNSRTGKEYSAGGLILTTLAEILNAYDRGGYRP